MSTRACRAQFLQGGAFLLALICFWISGPVALHHTDEARFYTAGQSAIWHTTLPTSQASCAACEWEQSFSHPPAPTVHVAALPFVRLRFAALLPSVLHLRCFDYTALRGPPPVFS